MPFDSIHDIMQLITIALQFLTALECFLQTRGTNFVLFSKHTSRNKWDVSHMQTKNMPPYAPTLIESTRAIGYSLEAAVADIIDNSIAASATSVDIFFFPIADAYIAFLDNGNGMDEQELDRAMQYGSKNPNEKRDNKDLGRFGLGLKTASLSQCRELTVLSKQGNTILGRRWDIDHVAETGEWSLLVLEDDEIRAVPQVEELEKCEKGTLVVWQKLDRLKAGEIDFEQSLGRKIDGVRSHLALVFHRYLSGEAGITRLNLRINGDSVHPSDPFLTKKSTQPMDDETLIIRGEKILVRPYILPHISRMTAKEIEMLGGKDGLRRQQGFYIYRNKRLLKWGTWFKMIRQGELSKLARIQVDIPNTLDDLWTLDIKKSTAMPPAEVRKNLEIIIDRIAERSKRTWTFRGKREVGDQTIHFWNRMKNPHGGVFYEINREHPMVEQIINKDPQVKHALFALFQQVERGLPLNQIYVDLNNDEQLVNDQEQTDIEIVDTLMAMIENYTDSSAKQAVLTALMDIEPFSSHKEVIEKLKGEI